MKSLISFIKKEFFEQARSGRMMILFILFVLFGIMNPAVAKMTPWLLEVMSDSLAASGMIITEVTVTALDSWVQFFKNIPMALIVFVLMESSVFTKEYSSGTLVLSLTKGLERYKVVLAKTMVMFSLWTGYYFICFGITYVYNAYFWDNSIAQSLTASVLLWWVFGIFVIALTVLFSIIFKTSSSVLVSVGGCTALSYVIGFLPRLKAYVPTLLMDGTSLIYGTAPVSDYLSSLVVAVVISVICLCISIPLFNNKQL